MTTGSLLINSGRVITEMKFLSVYENNNCLYINVTGGIPDLDTGEYSSVLTTLRRVLQSNPTMRVELYISSSGGYINTQSVLTNMLLQHNGVITTHGIGDVHSCATELFMIGSIRKIYAGADFMTHTCTLSIGRDTSAMVAKTAKRLHKHATKTFKRLFLTPGYLDEKYLVKFKAGEDIHLTPKQLLKYNIATHYINYNGVTKIKHIGAPK